MKKETLITTAGKLVSPGVTARVAYSKVMASMAEDVTTKMRERQDIDKLIGTENKQMMADNASNMARFMESVFIAFDPVIFVDTILWVFTTYRSHGFSVSFWPAHLNTWITVIESRLDEDVRGELLPFYKWMQVNIPVFTLLTDITADDGSE